MIEKIWKKFLIGFISFITFATISIMVQILLMHIFKIPAINIYCSLVISLTLYGCLLYLLYKPNTKNSNSKVATIIKEYFAKAGLALLTSIVFDAITLVLLLWSKVSTIEKNTAISTTDIFSLFILFGWITLKSYIIGHIFKKKTEKEQKEYYITAFFMTWMLSMTSLLIILGISRDFTPVSFIFVLLTNSCFVALSYFCYKLFKPEPISTLYYFLLFIMIIFFVTLLEIEAVTIFSWLLPVLIPNILGDIGITDNQPRKATQKFKQHIYNITFIAFISLVAFNLLLLCKPYLNPYLSKFLKDKISQNMFITFLSLSLGIIFSALSKILLQNYYFNPKNGFFEDISVQNTEQEIPNELNQQE